MSALDGYLSQFDGTISGNCEAREHGDCGGTATITCCGAEIGETDCGCECHEAGIGGDE